MIPQHIKDEATESYKKYKASFIVYNADDKDVFIAAYVLGWEGAEHEHNRFHSG